MHKSGLKHFNDEKGSVMQSTKWKCLLSFRSSRKYRKLTVSTHEKDLKNIL